jgi:hypothetical protein
MPIYAADPFHQGCEHWAILSDIWLFVIAIDIGPQLKIRSHGIFVSSAK